MAFDLGSLVTRMVVEGRGQFENDINAGGLALGRAAKQGDEFGLALGTMSTGTKRFSDGVAIAGAEVLSLGDRGRLAFTQVGTGLTVAGLAIGALVGLAVAKYAEYDAALSRSVAVTGAYGDELKAVRQLTLDLGSSTIFTATEAAEGVTELGKAGIRTSDILGGALSGSLSLAAAGELAVADAAAVSATTLNQFNLQGKDSVHVSDLLAAAAGKAQGSVTDMGMALKQSGLVANQMGLSVEETTGTLAAFASAGLIGSDAGTSFRTMLLALATPTAQQTELMKEYGIEAYKAGNFVGITSLAEQLRSGKLAQATQQQRDYALGVIFGSDAIRAANVLYDEGARGIQGWIGKVNDAGYAAKIAAINTDNLKGDLEKLGGAFDTALIKAGAGADGILRDLVQSTTELISGFSELPDWLQQVVLGGVALTAGLLLLAGATTIGIVKMIEFRAALAVIRAEMPLTTAAFGRLATFMTGPWGIAIAAAVVGLTLLNDWLQESKASTEELTAVVQGNKASAETMYETFRKGTLIRMDNLNNDLQRTLDLTGANPNAFSTFFAGVAVTQMRSTLAQVGETLADLVVTDLPSAQKAFAKFSAETDGTRESQIALLAAMPAYREALIAQATELGTYSVKHNQAQNDTALLALAQGESKETAQDAAAAYKEAADEADALGDQLSQLIDLVNEANGIGQDAVTSNAAYQDSLAGITDEVNSQKEAFIQLQRDAYEAANGSLDGFVGTLDGFSVSLDENTRAGSANAAMLAGVASDAQEAAQAQFDLDVKTMSAKDATDRYLETLSLSREALINQALANGFTAEEVQKLTDKIFNLPPQKQIDLLVDTATASTAVDGFITRFDGRRIRVAVDAVSGRTVYNNGTGVGMGWEAYGGIVRHMAAGGMLSNAGAQPQIKRAGDLTVWAEHETGGEAYVPFALDRRGRSEGLMQQIAGIFGGTYIPAGAGHAAEGMISGGVPVASAGVAPVFKIYIGETELRVIAQQQVDESLTELNVAYQGGTTE